MVGERQEAGGEGKDREDREVEARTRSCPDAPVLSDWSAMPDSQ